MAWIAIAVFLIIVALAFPRHKILLLIVAIAVGGVGGYLSWSKVTEKKTAKIRIPSNELTLTNIDISYNRKLTGQIKNSSAQYTLKELTLEVTLKECDKECTVAATTTARINTDIPPGNSRDFASFLHVEGLTQPIATYQWEQRIIETKAQ